MRKENIHDRLFKHTLSIPSEAKALVTQFLPEWLHEAIDFRTFKINTQSFVNENLDEYFTDIIYDCQWK
ncbi:MAG: Rpn family recombination-promoting nuclease/putative transposase, partial [Bacteroidota bacterium]